MDIKLKFDPRPEQDEILDAFKLSCQEEIPFLLVDAPTGVGKSYAAMLMANHWHETNGGKVDILTNSKMLQSQYMKDFPFLAELKGKSNYYCDRFNTNCDEGGDLAHQEGTHCMNCPHKIAYNSFLKSKASMVNFHLFSSYSMFVPGIMKKRDANMLVIDEAHSFEDVFTDFISLVISERVLKSVGLDDNPVVVEQMKKVKTSRDLDRFFNDFFQARVQKHIRELTDKVHKAETTKAKSGYLKNIKSAHRLLDRFKSFLEDEDRDRWIFQKEEAKSAEKAPHIKIEPIWARKYLWETIWKHYDKVVFMSATVLDAEIFSFLNGLSEEMIFCKIDSPFPAKQRQVYFKPVGRMSYRHKGKTIKLMIPRIKEILEENPNVKGIIHTGNYENAYKLKDAFAGSTRLLFHGPGNAEIALRKHERSHRNTVLVSPAMTHGVDLKEDLSRLQIIMKVPFPSLGDRRIKRRQKENDLWYTWKTWTEVVQSCGRSVRSKDDWAVTYILDSSFYQLLRQKQMMPDYFKEALVMP